MSSPIFRAGIPTDVQPPSSSRRHPAAVIGIAIQARPFLAQRTVVFDLRGQRREHMEVVCRRSAGADPRCYKLFDVMQSRTGTSGAAIVRRAIATSGSPTNAIAMKFVVG